MHSDIIKIAITGPESTGKSTLSQQLAEHYQTIYVPEYARTYIDQLNRSYILEDILEIAKRQVATEQALLPTANKLLFADTELLVTKIWSEHAFGKCPEWIEARLSKQDYTLYLLMNIDLAWEPDPQREHPHLRSHFFDKYQNHLENLGFSYKIISGTQTERTQNAIRTINHLLKI